MVLALARDHLMREHLLKETVWSLASVAHLFVYFVLPFVVGAISTDALPSLKAQLQKMLWLQKSAGIRLWLHRGCHGWMQG